MWKSVSASEKAKFEKAAADDKKRHEKELADYKARGGGADDDEAPKRKSTHTHMHTHTVMGAWCKRDDRSISTNEMLIHIVVVFFVFGLCAEAAPAKKAVVAESESESQSEDEDDVS